MDIKIVLSSYTNFEYFNKKAVSNISSLIVCDCQIKLPLFIKIDSKKFNTSLEFENILKKIDLINEFSIKKINKDFIYYEVIFNGTTKNFINIMSQKNYKFDTQKKIWILK